MKFTCIDCNYSTDDHGNWSKHKKSKKHIKNGNKVSNIDVQKNGPSMCTSTQLRLTSTTPHFYNDSNKNNVIKATYKCTYCELAYTRQDNLIRHLKICNEKDSKHKLLEEQFEKYKLERDLEFKNKEETLILKSEVEKLKAELEMMKKKEHLYENHIDTLKIENKFQKQLIESAGGMIKKSMNTMSYLLLNYNNAPPLEPLKDYSVLEDKNKFIDNLTYYHSKNKLDEYLGDFLVKHYKTEDPKERSNWNSDTSRLTYINRELVNNKPNWVIDKKGVKMTELIIDPYMQYIKKIAIEKIAEMKDICDDDDDYDNKKYIFNKMTSLNEIIQNINNKILSKEINKYLAPHFYFDKNNLLMVREN